MASVLEFLSSGAKAHLHCPSAIVNALQHTLCNSFRKTGLAYGFVRILILFIVRKRK